MAHGSTHHGGHAPDICAGAPLAAQDDLRRSVLPGLDVICEVMSDPAGVSEIGDFNRYCLKGLVDGRFEIWCASGTAGLVECDAGDFLGKKIAMEVSIDAYAQ